MKTLIFVIGLTSLSSLPTYASSESCPRGCHPPSRPREYKCKVEMVDCNHHSLYIYTGTASSHKSACRAATRVCLNEVRLGYGGYGAKCWMIGKKQLMSEM